MDEMVFLGALVGLLVAGFLLVRAFSHNDRGRKPNHPTHHETFSRRSGHRPASHTLVHSHSSASRMHAADDIWRNNRFKANESHWQTGVVTANRIFTDSERMVEERESEPAHGMSSIEYEPPVSSRPPTKAADKLRNRR